jgi:hypothetical protein
MDVTQENMTNVVRGKSRGAHGCGDRLESRFRAGIEERDPVIRLQRDRGDDSRPAKVFCIQDVDHVFAEC